MANYGWSNLTDIRSYPAYPNKPLKPELDVYAVSIGPAELNASQGLLNSRWWLCYQVAGGDVVIAGETGGVYGSTSVVFNEPSEIAQIALTFDQLGRPLVFYRTGADSLKLYWFDNVSGENEIKSIGTGTYPTACFDYPRDSNRSFTDAHLFYIDASGFVKQRLQRDRFDVVYQVQRAGVDAQGVKILTAGLTTENRLQVVYQ